MTQFEYVGRDLESMSFADNYHSFILDLFQPYIGKKVVEVGAGDGSFTRLISRRPVDSITAVEPSDDMYNRLKESTKELGNMVTALNGFLGDFEKEISKQKPDSFVFVNVFEHIEDDLGEMKRVFKMLPEGGHLCIFVPALPALYSEFDRSIDHFRRYTKKELESKCREAGFTVAYSRYFDAMGVIPWWLRFKLLKAGALSPSAVKLYDKIGVPVMKAAESLITPPIGKNVILVAKKEKS
jgi:SAM-dependent methyltransferase